MYTAGSRGEAKFTPESLGLLRREAMPWTGWGLTDVDVWAPLIPNLARASSLGLFLFTKDLGGFLREGRGRESTEWLPGEWAALVTPWDPPGWLYWHRNRAWAALVHADDVADLLARLCPTPGWRVRAADQVSVLSWLPITPRPHLLGQLSLSLLCSFGSPLCQWLLHHGGRGRGWH